MVRARTMRLLIGLSLVAATTVVTSSPAVAAGPPFQAFVRADGTAVINTTNNSENLELDGTGVDGEVEWRLIDLETWELTSGILVGVTRDVVVRTRGGPDGVIANRSLLVPRSLSISTDGGNDTVIVRSGGIGEDLKIVTAAGDDFVRTSGTTVGDDTIIATGSGDDRYESQDVGPYSDQFGDRLRLSTGSGNDHLRFRSLPATFAGPVDVDTSTGDDTLVVHRGVTFSDRVTVLTSGGADTVDLGTGRPAGLDATFLSDVKIVLGAGNDTLNLSRVTVLGLATASGGAGLGDTLNSDMNQTFAQPPKITGFELP